jgi:hypothetical protein
LTGHKSHNCSDIDSLLTGAHESVGKSIELCHDREKGLVNAMKAVRNTMYKLNEEREVSGDV